MTRSCQCIRHPHRPDRVYVTDMTLLMRVTYTSTSRSLRLPVCPESDSNRKRENVLVYVCIHAASVEVCSVMCKNAHIDGVPQGLGHDYLDIKKEFAAELPCADNGARIT